MTWIGLRDAETARFDPMGLGVDLPDGVVPDPDTLLPRGTLICEFRHDRGQTRRNLLRFATRSPWTSSLSICIDPDGSLILMQAQSNRHLSCTLHTDLSDAIETAIVSFSWDGPGRLGIFSLWVPDRGALFQTTLTGPIPLSLRDAGRIVGDPVLCPVDERMTWVGLSDRIEPAGPTPGLSASALVDTPHGPRPIHALRAGHSVLTAEGEVAQVIWSGSQEFPARGRFAPILMRAPYHGLDSDLVLAPDQRFRLHGSDVEYLFGLEEVSVAARHLSHDPLSRQTEPAWTVRYHQILLDIPGVLSVNGGSLESLDATSLVVSPGRLQHSLLAAVPQDLLPPMQQSQIHILRGFEAMTLNALLAA